MAKHSLEFKMSVVQYYLDGTQGYKEVGRRHGIAFSLVKRWVAFFRHHGVEGLRGRPRNTTWSPEFKMSVLQHMWDNNLSYGESAARFNIRSQCVVGIWDRGFRKDGYDSLTSSQAGDTIMPEPSAPPPEKSPADDLRSREELLKELNYLRMEVAVLKKFEALAQAKQAAALKKRK